MKRTPPYGKRIFEARNAGHHPLELHVHFGGLPARALRQSNGIWLPVDLEPDSCDWRLATGLPVILWDARFYSQQQQPERILRVAGEIADHAAWIWLVSRRCNGELEALADRLMAFGQTLPWWPRERAERYAERHAAWVDSFHAGIDRSRSLCPGDGRGGITEGVTP